MIHFGIIGMGKMGRIRASEILARNDACLDAICDSDESRLEGFEGVARYGDASQLLATELDAVVICAYNNVAARYAIEALEKGIHVFCEKPPARTALELEGVAKVARERDLVVKYGFNHRYHYSVMEAKKLAERNALGQLLWMKGTYGKAGGCHYEQEWRNDIELSGGGILIDQGIHMLDLMLMFGGEPRSVDSIVQSSYWSAAVEDNVFAVMQTDQGVSAMLHSSAVLWRHQFLLELCFEDGLVALDGILSSTRSYADERLVILRREHGEHNYAVGKPREERITFDQDNSWKLELEEFVQAVRGNAALTNGTIDDALRLMRALELIYESAGWTDRNERVVGAERRRPARERRAASPTPLRQRPGAHAHR